MHKNKTTGFSFFFLFFFSIFKEHLEFVLSEAGGLGSVMRIVLIREIHKLCLMHSACVLLKLFDHDQTCHDLPRRDSSKLLWTLWLFWLKVYPFRNRFYCACLIILPPVCGLFPLQSFIFHLPCSTPFALTPKILYSVHGLLFCVPNVYQCGITVSHDASWKVEHHQPSLTMQYMLSMRSHICISLWIALLPRDMLYSNIFPLMYSK